MMKSNRGISALEGALMFIVATILSVLAIIFAFDIKDSKCVDGYIHRYRGSHTTISAIQCRIRDGEISHDIWE